MSSFGPFVEDISRKTARTNSAYLQDRINIGDRWITTLGVRDDDHEQFGSKVTYHVASSYLFPSTGTRLKGTYGTGLQGAHALPALLAPTATPPCSPRRAPAGTWAWSSRCCNDKVTVGATYFKNQFKNLIDFGPMFSYVNVGKAQTKGVESVA